MSSDEKWNARFLPSPQPYTTTTKLKLEVKRKLSVLRSELFGLKQILTPRSLDVEAATLSRFLYKNYRRLNKDKGFQLMKMVMTSLNKYLGMKVADQVDLMRDVIPPNFSPLASECSLPSREVFGWLLARIQATIALFYRVYSLCKKAGKQLFGRLRLHWNPPVLIFGLGMTARIYVLARYMVQHLVGAYDSLVPYSRILTKVDDEFYKTYPRDIRKYFGGMDDVLAAVKPVSNTVDMTMQLIDLTEDDETEQREFIETLKYFQGGDEDEEVQRICEIVNLDATLRKIDNDEVEVVTVKQEEEDIGETVVICDEIVELSSSDFGASSTSTGKRRRRALKTPTRTQNRNKKAKLIETITISSETSNLTLNGSPKKRRANKKLA